MPSVNPIYITTTPISRLMDQNDRGLATGFFFQGDKKELYLVTNKHVIYGERYYENPSPEINKIKLKLHTNPQNLSQNEEVLIELGDQTNKIWLEHLNRDIDIVLIPIIIDRAKYVIAPLSKINIDASNIEVGFEKIFVIGYPYGWYDDVNNIPIVRVGHLSSPFKIPFQGKPLMLGDVETHKGMSGGPVFMEVRDYTTIEGTKRIKHLGQSKRILVGVHSGQPRWDLLDRNTGEVIETIRHTLIHVWFSDLILEISMNT